MFFLHLPLGLLGLSLSLAVPVWMAGVLALLIMVAVWWGWRDLDGVPHQLALRSLRLATALLGWLVAVQPQWGRDLVRDEKGHVALLIDASRSMQIRADEGSSDSRFDAAMAYVAKAQKNDPAMVVEAFDSKVIPIPQEPRGDETALLKSVKDFAFGADRQLGAVVLLSDGGETSLAAQQQLQGSLSKVSLGGLKVHTLVVGEEELRDDAISAVEADAVGFLRQPLAVSVTAVARGISVDMQAVITFKQDGELIMQREVLLPPDEPVEVRFEVTPTKLGRRLFEVEIPTLKDDAVPQNNKRAFIVRVQRDRLRVLLVAGAPSWDVRFMREFLKRDASVDLISFFILRTTNDLTMASPDELALIPFPTDELFREHLGSFDLIVFQNFDYGPYDMQPYLPGIRDYVARGGGFVMIGGDRSFAAGGYRGTALEEVLPVLLPQRERVVEGEVQARVVSEMAGHPILSFDEQGADTWRSLEPLTGLNSTQGLRKGASLLLEHGKHPVLVVGRYGKGRTLALMSDTSWKWGMTTGGRTGDASAYDLFWDQAYRWLSGDPAMFPKIVNTDREHYGPGSELSVFGVLRDEQYRPLSNRPYDVLLNETRHRFVTDETGSFSLKLTAPKNPGGYEVSVKAERSSGVDDVLCSVGLVVDGGGDELSDPRSKPKWLKALSEASSATSMKLSDAPELSTFDSSIQRQLGRSQFRPMSHPIAIIALLSLLLLEWLGRRRAGLR